MSLWQYIYSLSKQLLSLNSSPFLLYPLQCMLCRAESSHKHSYLIRSLPWSKVFKGLSVLRIVLVFSLHSRCHSHYYFLHELSFVGHPHYFIIIIDHYQWFLLLYQRPYVLLRLRHKNKTWFHFSLSLRTNKPAKSRLL